jgi:hypothetical protein
MQKSNLREYKVGKGVKKGVLMAGAVATGIVTAVGMLGDVTAVESIPLALVIGAAFGGLRAGVNFYKNR